MNLGRLITVLEAVAAAGRPLSAAELEAATSVPRPTCYRMLQTLSEHGLLEDEAGRGRFQIGERLLRLALTGQSDFDIRRAAEPKLIEAADRFGEAVFLSRFRGDGVEIIHVAIPSDPAVSYIHPGLGRRPMHACSCSKVIAAFADDDYQNSILTGPLKAYTPRTKQDEATLRAEFEEIRQRGYAECVEEIDLGVTSVAAPIRIDNLSAAFSVGSTGSVRRFGDARRRELGDELRALANNIAASFRVSLIT